jgi:hypothetical protein
MSDLLISDIDPPQWYTLTNHCWFNYKVGKIYNFFPCGGGLWPELIRQEYDAVIIKRTK